MTAKGHRSAGVIPWADIPILSLLPKEGAKVGQYKPLAITTRGVRDALGADEFTSDEVSARLRSLEVQGYVANVQLTNDRKGWQITPSGERKLAEMKQEA